ncbi:MAG TPA: hypothetical protein VF932_10125 [Anaerolineae bacterium]
MVEILHYRSWVFWWGLLTASFFVQEWLKRLGEFFKTSTIFASDKLPFSTVSGLNKLIDDWANSVPASVQFDPGNKILGIGPLNVYGWMLAAFFGAAIFILAIYLYVRALSSPAWYDDFVALFFVYLTFRLEGHIVAIAKLPIENNVRAFVDNPTTAFISLLLLTLGLVFFGQGFRSKRAFWRALIEITLVAMFMFPHETANAISYIIQLLGTFGSELDLTKNPSFAVIWGLIGMFLALQRLMTEGVPSSPLGRGQSAGGGAKPGGGAKAAGAKSK